MDTDSTNKGLSFLNFPFKILFRPQPTFKPSWYLEFSSYFKSNQKMNLIKVENPSEFLIDNLVKRPALLHRVTCQYKLFKKKISIR